MWIAMNYIRKVCSEKNGKIGFVCFDDDDESYAQMLNLQKYLNKTNTKSIVDDISTLKFRYDDKGKMMCQPSWKLFDKQVSCIINSYPKEWLITEIESDALLGEDLADVESFEPFWKLILGNKAILPLLW